MRRSSWPGRLRAVDLTSGPETLPPDSVVGERAIGHAGDSNDLDYLTELADAGVLPGMDRFGLGIFNPVAERIKTIAVLAARGYAASMVLAHDANCFIDYFGAAHDMARAAAAPNWHYEHISDECCPPCSPLGSPRRRSTP